MEGNKRRFKSYILSVLVLLITGFIMYNVLTVNKTYYKNEKDINISIFVYHDIVDNEDEVKYDYMQTTDEKLEEQIKGLQAFGYHFISYEDLIQYNNGQKALPKKTCIITFDDGWDGVYTYAYPIAKKYNVPITSFIINNLIGTEGYFDWKQAKEMQDSGIVQIASHSLDHEKFDKKTTEEAVKNVNESYSEIKEKANGKLKIFTYPCGIYTDEQVIALGKEGYIQNLTDNKINSSSKLNMQGLHRCYPLNDSVPKIILKIVYRNIRYK